MKPVTACTVITKNYLAYARTLAHSLMEHNSDAKLYVLLADQLNGCFDPYNEPFHLIELKDLGMPETIERMCFYYEPFELCNSLKGLLHQYMFENTQEESWFYFDSDILILHSIEELRASLDYCSILLSPHHILPVIDTDSLVLETQLLRFGVFNGGFMGVRRTESSRRFVSWFNARLLQFALNNMSQGMFVDQLWLNLVPLYFTDVRSLMVPGANVGYWNLHERRLSEDTTGSVLVNGQPLLFFHFSHWRIDEPRRVARLALNTDRITDETAARLGERYGAALYRNGILQSRVFPYSFSHFSTRQRITRDMRRAYWQEALTGSPQGVSPFDDHKRIANLARSERKRKDARHLRTFTRVAHTRLVQALARFHILTLGADHSELYR